MTPEALEAWAPAKTGRRGRPTFYLDIVIETAVMLCLAMSRPWRQTEGVLRSLIQMLRNCLQTERASRCWPGCYFEVNEG